VIGERVRLAREASLLTQKELAEASGVPPHYLSDLEYGRIVSPSDEAIENLARAMSYPVGFFYCGPLPDVPDGHYRRLKRGTSREAKRVRAQVRQVVELVQKADSDPTVKLPPVKLQAVDTLLDMEHIETAAEDTRVVLGLDRQGPVPNMTRAAERGGVVVVGLAGAIQDHSGFSVWPDYGLDGRPVIALARSGAGDRDRLTIGHEIGHLVLHTLRNVDSDVAELEAFRFAGALALPAVNAQQVLRAPVTLTVLRGVKANYGISMAAAAMRGRDLNLIDANHFRSLMKQLSARGWRKQEPVEVAPENPLLIPKIIDAISGEGSASERATRANFPAFAFRALTA
jgi:Zn-dependent peptidase ImmA (M78 family)/transcriptional regulator with XRE-family HTH domain